MSLRDFIAKQFIEVVQWTESEEDVLAWRFPMRDMEIMNGGKLTVRESQAAAFVNEGRIADVFGPGLYNLSTQNLPILTDLMNWDKQFKSPFKSDVYFFSTRIKTNQRWGTATPITIRDRNSERCGCAVTGFIRGTSTIRECSTPRSAARARSIACRTSKGSCATPSSAA